MNLLKITRYRDWWDYKIPPILAISYGSLHLAQERASDHLQLIAWQVLTLIAGAIFVSVLNDFTDIEDDMRSHKNNSLSNSSPTGRNLILAASICCCAVIAAYYYPDWKTILLFLASCLFFVFYSAPPFRWKNNTIAGLIADSSGSQMFPSLMMITSVAFCIGTDFTATWFMAVLIWSLSFGLRGILWHQFADRANDLISGSKSFATHTDLQKVRPKIIALLIVETVALCALFLLLHSFIVITGFILYWLLLLLRMKFFQSKLIIVLNPGHKKYHIIYNEFYQVFLPVSLLIALAYRHPCDWIIVAVHLLVFSKITRTLCKDVYRMLEMALRTNYEHKE